MNLDDIFKNGFKNFLLLAAAVSVICTIIWLSIDKKIDKFNKTYPERAVSKTFVSAAVRFAYTFFGLLIVLSQIKPLEPVMETLLSAGGVMAICVTFAAQESFGNYIAGFLMAMNKSFRIGEEVNLKSLDVSGTVKEITFRHTVIETESGSIVTIPNAIMNSIVIEDVTNVKKSKARKKKTSSDK